MSSTRLIHWLPRVNLSALINVAVAQVVIVERASGSSRDDGSRRARNGKDLSPSASCLQARADILYPRVIRQAWGMTPFERVFSHLGPEPGIEPGPLGKSRDRVAGELGLDVQILGCFPFRCGV